MVALREMNDDDLKDLGVDATISRRRIIDAVDTKVFFALHTIIVKII